MKSLQNLISALALTAFVVGIVSYQVGVKVGERHTKDMFIEGKLCVVTNFSVEFTK